MTLDAVRQDVESFHVFFVRWIGGDYEDADAAFARELEARLGSEFTYVFPSGTRLSRADVCAGLREGWGTNPAFEIDVEDVRVVDDEGSLIVASYVERQRNAINSEPTNARHSTVVMRRDAQAPGGLRWVHLQETALPPAD